jgi:hypothetical protein
MSISHHSEEEFQKQQRFIEQVLKVASPRFPQGVCNPQDEGELAFAMAVDHRAKLLRIEFGKPVGWLAMPLREAREFQALLAAKITELEEHPTR